jgi:hypothetical protein
MMISVSCLSPFVGRPFASMICMTLVIIRMMVLAEKRGDEGLLEFAAIQTLLNGGTIYRGGAEKMPEPDPFAAVFRY